MKENLIAFRSSSRKKIATDFLTFACPPNLNPHPTSKKKVKQGQPARINFEELSQGFQMVTDIAINQDISNSSTSRLEININLKDDCDM